jgi:hypothetical protein
LERVDTAVAKSILTVAAGQSSIIAFPAQYSRKYLEGSADFKDCSYFIPDSTTLIKMNDALKTQYCDAKRYRATRSYTWMIKEFGKEYGKKYIREQKQAMKSDLDFIDKICDQKRVDLDSIDKQVIAFTSAKYKGKVLLIQLLDFRDDPYKLKELSRVQFIDGWHGWFETNREWLYYNIEENKLSVHGEDF